MRIRLDLNYVLRRTCDSQWVGWCPELCVMSQGSSMNNALWMVREAVRITIENEIALGKHPTRIKAQMDTDDEDFPFYQQFVARYMEEGDADKWDRTYREKHVPPHVDTVAVNISTDVETYGENCLISDSWYGEFWYLGGEKKTVTALVEMTYTIPEHAQHDVQGYITSVYGHKIVEIK